MDEITQRLIAALFKELPNQIYNPICIVADPIEVFLLMKAHLKIHDLFVKIPATEAAMTDLGASEYYLLTDFEKVEGDLEYQSKLADYIGNWLIEHKQLIIFSKKRIRDMSIDGRLRSRICSGVVIE